MSPPIIDLEHYYLEPITPSAPPEPRLADLPSLWVAPASGCWYLFVWLILNTIVVQLAVQRESHNTMWLLLPFFVIAAMIGLYRFHGHLAGRESTRALFEERRHSWRQKVADLSAQSDNEARETACSVRALLVQAKDHRRRLFLALDQAATWLDRATHEHGERAFAPFWDAVEEAAAHLGYYQIGVRELARVAQAYSRSLKGRRHNFPPFPYLTQDIPSAADVLNRLKLEVRRGQTDFEFATVWEQRKTRETIKTGFGSLAAAVREVGTAVTAALQEAQHALEKGLGEVSAASSASSAILEGQRKELIEILERQDRKLEDIRRRRL